MSPNIISIQNLETHEGTEEENEPNNKLEVSDSIEVKITSVHTIVLVN